MAVAPIGPRFHLDNQFIVPDKLRKDALGFIDSTGMGVAYEPHSIRWCTRELFS